MRSIYLKPHNGLAGESPIAPFAGHEIVGGVPKCPVDVVIHDKGRDFTFSHPTERHWIFRETVKFREAA